MKSTFWLLACLPFILVSCSSYQKVSLTNFKEYKVAYNERGDLQYVLKTHKLHYSDIDRRYIINNYEAIESTAYESHSFHINDNIVIPTGAFGVCVNSYEDNFIIDFGKGVLVPFIVYNDNNRAKGKIVVDERAYSLVVSNRNASLYFNTRELKKPKSRHTVSGEINKAQQSGEKEGE